MHRIRVGLLAVAVLTMTLPSVGAAGQEASPAASPAPSPAMGEDDARLYEAVRPEQRNAIAAETADRLSRYRLEAAVTADAVELGAEPGAEEPAVGRRERLDGTLDLRFVNDTGAPLGEIYLRLFPNDPRYAEGDLTLKDVSVDGDAVVPALSVDDTVARLPLAAPLAVGEAVEVELAFTTRVVATFDFESSRFNVDTESGTITLLHWYPIVAGYDPEGGWVLDPIGAYGDIVVSNAALYDVTLTTERELRLVTTGVQVADEAVGDEVRRTYVTGPARHFMMVADRDFASVSQEVDGTTITSYYNPDQAAAGAKVLAYGVRALAVFNELQGPYPYAELDLVELPFFTAAGPEFPHLTGLDASLYQDTQALIEFGITERLVEFVVAQGVANQWWSQLVETNHYRHAFLDEAVSDYAAVLYVEAEYGGAEAERVLDLVERTFYSYIVFATGDQVVDQPSDDFPDGGSYFGIVYGKGSLGFHALRGEVGDDAFVAALRDYYARHRFAMAQPADLRAAFERASARDLAGFWEAWFESAQTEVSILIETEPAGATPTP